MAVWPVEDARPGSIETSAPVPRPFSSHSPFRRLLPAAWHAFVLPPRHDTERRYIHRQNGFVRAAHSLPAEEAAQWVEVEPIPIEEQRGWALELLSEIGLGDDADLHDIVGRQDWHVSFRQALEERDRIFASRWNRIRSSRVQSHVEAWCERNGVAHEVVFQPYRFPRAETPKTQEEQESHDGARQVERLRPSELRRVLLDALGRMTTDELLTLNIPPRYLLAAARPGIVRE